MIKTTLDTFGVTDQQFSMQAIPPWSSFASAPWLVSKATLFTSIQQMLYFWFEILSDRRNRKEYRKITFLFKKKTEAIRKADRIGPSTSRILFRSIVCRSRTWY